MNSRRLYWFAMPANLLASEMVCEERRLSRELRKGATMDETAKTARRRRAPISQSACHRQCLSGPVDAARSVCSGILNGQKITWGLIRQHLEDAKFVVQPNTFEHQVFR